MLVIHDYLLYANTAHAKQTDTITYEEIRDFSNILLEKLVKKKIYFITETTDNSCLTIKGHSFIRENEDVLLMHAMDDKFMKSINGCYPEEVQKLIEEAHNEFFLKNTEQGKRIKLMLEKKEE